MESGKSVAGKYMEEPVVAAVLVELVVVAHEHIVEHVVAVLILEVRHTEFLADFVVAVLVAVLEVWVVPLAVPLSLDDLEIAALNSLSSERDLIVAVVVAEVDHLVTDNGSADVELESLHL